MTCLSKHLALYGVNESTPVPRPLCVQHLRKTACWSWGRRGLRGLVDYLVRLSLVTDLEAESVRRNVLPTDTKPVSGRHRKKTEVS